MQTGRMKGQAFIGLPSEEIAVQALKETNGYLLQGKPIAVVNCIYFLVVHSSIHIL